MKKIDNFKNSLDVLKNADYDKTDTDELYPIEVKKGIAPGNPGKSFKVLEKFGKVDFR